MRATGCGPLPWCLIKMMRFRSFYWSLRTRIILLMSTCLPLVPSVKSLWDFLSGKKRATRKFQFMNKLRSWPLPATLCSVKAKPMLHAHVVVGKADGTAHGGHFLGGRVWPTLEMIVTEMPVH